MVVEFNNFREEDSGYLQRNYIEAHGHSEEAGVEAEILLYCPLMGAEALNQSFHQKEAEVAD